MKFKLTLIIFSIGLILGVGLSPWASSKPQQAFISPVENVQALENSQINSKKDSNTLKKMFSKFDQQQKLLKPDNKILGEKTQNTNPSPSAQPIKVKSIKSGNLTIAVFGDSMVDTMETNLPYLEKKLKSFYLNIKFNLLNYGIGSQNAKDGNNRFNNSFSYKDRNYLSILNSNADIIIVESFAYNPMDSVDEYDQNLRSILNKAKDSGKKIYFLATIAPLKKNFGKGPGGVNWDNDTAWNHATKIQEHMERGIAIARDLSIPIIDCYHTTLQNNGEGIVSYVNSHDGIHPSVAGHNYIAEKIAKTIEF